MVCVCIDTHVAHAHRAGAVPCLLGGDTQAIVQGAEERLWVSLETLSIGNATLSPFPRQEDRLGRINTNYEVFMLVKKKKTSARKAYFNDLEQDINPRPTRIKRNSCILQTLDYNVMYA